MTAEQRVKAVSDLGPEIASFNAGSINFALFHAADKWKNWKYDWEKNTLK